MGKTAWGDESVRMMAPVPTYLLAAAILPEGCDLSRLQAVKPKGAAKLHWHELTDELRERALAAAKAMEPECLIVAAAPIDSREERARRKCLEVLLPQLEARGVDTLVMETRQAQKDKKDIEMLMALRRRHTVSSIVMQHVGARDEPRLWLPDQVLGAYGATRDSPSPPAWKDAWEALSEHVVLFEITP